MTYTAEQLRDMASLIEEQEVPADGQQIKMLRAHADALEENARLRAELAKLRANRDFWMESCKQAQQHRDGANEQLAIVEAELAKLRQHAEAMAEHWEKDDTMNMMQSAVDAYRRDYPEGTT